MTTETAGKTLLKVMREIYHHKCQENLGKTKPAVPLTFRVVFKSKPLPHP